MHESNLPDMSCSHCASVVTRACQAFDDKARVEVDLGTKHVRVLSDSTWPRLAEALTEAGYPPAW